MKPERPYKLFTYIGGQFIRLEFEELHDRTYFLVAVEHSRTHPLSVYDFAGRKMHVRPSAVDVYWIPE